MKLVVDTSVLVASLDALDSLHHRGRALVETIDELNGDVLLLDCVVVETITVLSRRRAERRRRPSRALPAFADLFAASRVTRAYPLLELHWAEILAEVDASGGAISPHDALILTFARERSASGVVTLDAALRGRGVDIAATPAELHAIAGA